jgi:hypothetical protein
MSPSGASIKKYSAPCPASGRRQGVGKVPEVGDRYEAAVVDPLQSECMEMSLSGVSIKKGSGRMGAGPTKGAVATSASSTTPTSSSSEADDVGVVDDADIAIVPFGGPARAPTHTRGEGSSRTIRQPASWPRRTEVRSLAGREGGGAGWVDGGGGLLMILDGVGVTSLTQTLSLSPCAGFHRGAHGGDWGCDRPSLGHAFKPRWRTGTRAGRMGFRRRQSRGVGSA